MKRNIKRRTYKQLKKNVICFICLTFISISIGYAAFSTNIKISSKGNVKGIMASQLLKTKVITSGDGLYKDIYEDDRFVYRGTNPDNYIKLDNDLYRIISVESDNTLKVMKSESIGKFPYDTAGTRYEDNTYCNNNSYGCDWWSNKNDTLDETLQNISYVQNFSGTGTLTLPTQSSSINKHLNDEYILTLTSKYIENHIFNIGYVGSNQGDSNITIESALATEKLYKWKGYIGLLNVSDYMKASLGNCSNIHDNNCGGINFLNHSNVYAFMNSAVNQVESDYGDSIRYTNGKGGLNLLGYNPDNEFEIYPVFYLSSSILLIGSGTESQPYQIT